MSAFIDGHRVRFGVEPMCKILGVSVSADYTSKPGGAQIYALDADFGPFFLKFFSYFPYNAKLCLNGNEWAK